MVWAKHDDLEQKMTSMMENAEKIKASSKEELDILQLKLNHANERIKKFKMENDFIIVQLDVAKEKYKGLAHIIEASKTRKAFDLERQSPKGTIVSSSNLTSGKTNLPDFKEDDDVFEVSLCNF